MKGQVRMHIPVLHLCTLFVPLPLTGNVAFVCLRCPSLCGAGASVVVSA